MSIDQEFLFNNGVATKIIDMLFDIFGSNIPELPVSLKNIDKDGCYFAPNAYYAAKILIAQDKRPSATSIHKLIGGKTSKVFDNVRKLKELVPAEFEPLVVDPIADSMAAVKRELVKAEKAQFNAELREQERYASEQLEKDAKKYEKRIHELEVMLGQSKGQNGILEGLATDHQRTIAHLQAKLLDAALSKQKLEHTETIANERFDLIEQLKKSAKATEDAYQHERTESAKTIKDLREERDFSVSQQQRTLMDLKEAHLAISTYQENQEQFIIRAAELTNQLNQNQLQLKHETSTDDFIKAINSSMKPFHEISELVVALTKVKKASAIDMKTVHTSLNDVSTKLLNLNKTISTLKKS